MRQLKMPALCLCAGLVSVFAFAPFGWWPLQCAALALLFVSLERAPSAAAAAGRAFAYGIGCFSFGIYWPYVSMHRYGDMPAWMAALATVLLAMLLASFAAAATYATVRAQRRWRLSSTLTRVCLLPAALLLADWVKSWILTGFPWLSIGYAHTASPLAGFAPVLGVYGVGGLAAVMAGALSVVRLRPALASLAIAIPITGAALSHVRWTAPAGAPIRVSLLQGNIPQDEKFAQDNYGFTLQWYADMLQTQDADLVATPETAIPDFAERLPPTFLDHLDQSAQTRHARYAIGIMHLGADRSMMNSVLVLGNSPYTSQQEPSPSAGPAASPYWYAKHHLVPFGEFIPTGFRWFVDLMHIPIGDQTRGPELQAPFPVRDQWILPNICYEDLFGEEIAVQIHHRITQHQPAPTILLNVSNLAWFGEWLAVPQHLQISQMRALETGRSVLRSTNTGATAVIHPSGHVDALLAPYTRGALVSTVQGFDGVTPFIVCGNLPAVLLAVAAWAWAWLSARRQSRTTHE